MESKFEPANSELWKDIDGYGGLYQISKWGAVRRVRSDSKTSPVAVCRASNGKSCVYLYSNGHQKCYMLHHLYERAFDVSPKTANRILYEGYTGDSQAKENVKTWLKEKIIECIDLRLSDEALYLTSFLHELDD